MSAYDDALRLINGVRMAEPDAAPVITAAQVYATLAIADAFVLRAPDPQVAAPPWDDPELDGTDGAHPAWWRGNDHGFREGLSAVGLADAIEAACPECQGTRLITVNADRLTPGEGGPEPDERDCWEYIHRVVDEFRPSPADGWTLVPPAAPADTALREALAEGLHKAMCYGPDTLHNRLACERPQVYGRLADAALEHPAMRALQPAAPGSGEQ